MDWFLSCLHPFAGGMKSQSMNDFHKALYLICHFAAAELFFKYLMFHFC